MSDPTSQAKQARETLANALRALQSDPSVPPDLMAVAEPVSQAMGALFQIERNGAVTTAPAARDHIRTALGQLQAFPGQHPAVATAMEAVASTLGIVFGLVKLAEAGAAPAAPAAQAYQAPAPQAYQAPQQPAAAPQAYQAPPQAAPQAYQAPPQQQAYQAPAQQPAYQAPPQAAPQAYQPPPQAAPQAYQAPPQQVPQAPAPQAAPAGALKFEAALGTNSATNFYKGLSGNDVVEHGGIFVATYQKAPKVGSVIQLKVALPGGYDFDAACEVMWTREAAGDGADALPGFGARFKQVSQEARQLIYRYVRNREPLFHDDF